MASKNNGGNHERPKLGSPQNLPGQASPPTPFDDRPGAGMSLGEIIKDRVGEITTGMKDHEEPSVAAGDDDSLQKDAGKKDKARGNYTRVTTLSYDEVDPS